MIGSLDGEKGEKSGERLGENIRKVNRIHDV